VQLRGPGTVIQETHFVLARQFWVYILITLAGTVFTLLYILWLSKRRAL
jgi:hypothetical protein